MISSSHAQFAAGLLQLNAAHRDRLVRADAIWNAERTMLVDPNANGAAAARAFLDAHGVEPGEGR
jgi:hypothetical protein